MSYQRLLASLDGSQRSECVLPWASHLAEQNKAQLLLTQVIRPPDMQRRVPLTTEEQHLMEQLIEINRSEGAKYLFQIKAHLPGNVEPRQLTSDSAAIALHEVCEQEAIELVFISAHCYAIDTRWPYGTEVVGLVAYGNAPLLIMPDVPAETLEPSKAQAAANADGGR
jgi:nucleotide-binding universal stress UspA family protein